ncbi:MAG: hypothetical protein JW940_00145 [Polyangiaceae bacterium]|nr:hypothetical protein [Polyangiaceae bacterium]
MRTHAHTTAPLGQLVAAVFDEAALCSDDSREVSRLATQAVVHLLERLRRPSHGCGRWPSEAIGNQTDGHGEGVRRSAGR